MKMYIDPESGWRFGFPKLLPDNYFEMSVDEFHQWLWDNGYPHGVKPYYVRYFESDL